MLQNTKAGIIDIPVYSSGQYRVRSRLNIGIGLQDNDYLILSKDLQKNCGSVDIEDRKVIEYLNRKYPEWIYLDKQLLSEKLNNYLIFK